MSSGSSGRYHGLDALRGLAMLLGIGIHGAMPYIPNVEEFWPADASSSPLMSLTLPWIFHYGKTGEFIFFYANEGQPFHLWFLWQLIIFVIFTAILRFFYLGVVGVAGRLRRIGLRA